MNLSSIILAFLNVPPTFSNKAVSNGAVSFYLDGVVSSRVSRLTYGVQCYSQYDSTDPEHRKRGHLIRVHEISGEPILKGSFSTILSKVVVELTFSQFTDSRYPFQHRTPESRKPLNSGKASAYQTLTEIRSATTEPLLLVTLASPATPDGWTKNQVCHNLSWNHMDLHHRFGPDMYSKICTVRADISSVKLSVRQSTTGVSYYRSHFDVVLLFGLTELKAQIAYLENVRRHISCLIFLI